MCETTSIELARLLLGAGVPPDAILEATHAGQGFVAMRCAVGEAAQWTVEETTGGRLWRREWKPFQNREQSGEVGADFGRLAAEWAQGATDRGRAILARASPLQLCLRPHAQPTSFGPSQSPYLVQGADDARSGVSSFAMAHCLLGAARLWTGRSKEAFEPFHRGLRLNPHGPQAFLWLQLLATAHFLEGNSSEAEAIDADAVAMRSDSFSAHCILACSLADLGRTEEARREVDEMNRVVPSGYALSELLGRLTQPTDRERLTAALYHAGWQGQSSACQCS